MSQFFAAVPQTTAVTLISKPQDTPDMSERPQTYDIILTNLPLEVTRNNVQQLFTQYRDRIQSITVRPDRLNPTSIAYVRFTEKPLAEQLANDLNGFQWMGNQIGAKRTEHRKNPGEQKQLNQRSNGSTNQQQGNQPPKRGWSQQTGFGAPPPLPTAPPTGPPPPVDWVANSRQAFTPEEWTPVPVQPCIPDKEKVFVVNVDTPVEFWAQEGDADKILEVDRLLQSLIQSEFWQPITESRPEFNQLYCAQYSHDNLWYRCQAVSYVSQEKTVIHFVDYGNHETVPNSAIYSLSPELADLPPMARRYRLRDVQPVADRGTAAFLEGVEAMKILTDGHLCELHLHGSDERVGVKIVDIFDQDGRDIKEELLRRGLVRPSRPSRCDSRDSGVSYSSNGGAESATSNGFHKMKRDFPQAPNFFAQGNLSSAQTEWNPNRVDHFAQGDSNQIHGVSSPRAPTGQRPLVGRPNSREIQQAHQQQYQPQQHQPQHQQQQHQPQHQQQLQHQAQHHQFHSQHQQQQNQQMNLQQKKMDKSSQDKVRGEMQAKVDKVQRELEKTKRDAAQEVQKYQSRVKLMEEEISNLQSQLEQVDISSKLSNLVSAVNHVRKLRVQFPTDETPVDDLVEGAISLVTDKLDRISPDIAMIKAVESAQTRNTAAADRIRDCGKVEELQKLIADRDRVRRELYDSLTTCIDKTSQLPLERRREKLKTCVDQMRLTYSNYLTDSPIILDSSLDQLVQNFHDWKYAKNHELSSARTITNTCHNTLHGALQTLQEQLSVDEPIVLASPMGGPTLDSVVLKFTHAVLNETQISNFEQTSDCPVITKLIKQLVAELSEELKTIENLCLRLEEYRLEKTALEPWLTRSPDLGQIISIRKKFRSLKSKLRHKLADLQDAEEGDEADQAAEIKEEIKQVRQEIHATFLEEDQIMTEIVDLHLRYFPELDLLNPDLGLSTYVAYGGILKPCLDIDQFELRPFPGSHKPGVHLTTFNGAPAVLKEFILDESQGPSRQAFLQTLAEFSRCKNDHLSLILAAFMHKNQRQAYVITPYYDSLIPRIEEGLLSDEEVYTVVSGVLQALTALHERGLVHGSVHHQNVFIRGETGILTEFHFNKSLAQRCTTVHSTSSGLMYAAPETRTNPGLYGMGSDMYSFGILILYLLSPDTNFPLGDHGIPEYGGYGLKQNYSAMLDKLLVVDFSKRPTSRELLDSSHMISLAQTTTSPHQASIQLRSKSPSPTNEKKNGSGILKNGKSRGSSPPGSNQRQPASETNKPTSGISPGAAENTEIGGPEEAVQQTEVSSPAVGDAAGNTEEDLAEVSTESLEVDSVNVVTDSVDGQDSSAHSVNASECSEDGHPNDDSFDNKLEDEGK